MTARRKPVASGALAGLAEAHHAIRSAEVGTVAKAFLPLFRKQIGLSFACLLAPEESRGALLLIGGSLGTRVVERRYPEARNAALAAFLLGRRRKRWTAADLPSELRRRGDAGYAIPLDPKENGGPRLFVRDRDVEKLDGADAAALIANLAAAVANADAYRRALDLSFRDELAGVYNYRFLMEALERETRRAQRFGHVFSIIMLDIDNLKEYNDRHGHLRGSEVIRTIGGLLPSCLRRVDLPAKYGGDEFAIILPRSDKAGARQVSERIRRRIERHHFAGDEGPGAITASFGVSTYPKDGKTPLVLLRKADRALYRAKAQGRNTVSD